MIDLIKPPTDNLYKFLAIFGTVVFLASLIFPMMLFYQSGLELLKSAAGEKELAVHKEFAKERNRILKERKQQLEFEEADLQRRRGVLANNNTSSASEIDKLELAIKDAKRRAETLEDASHELDLNLRLKSAQVEQQTTFSRNETRNSRFVLWVGCGVGIHGLSTAFFGFIIWYFGVQRFQDRILSREANSEATTKKNAQETAEASDETE